MSVEVAIVIGFVVIIIVYLVIYGEKSNKNPFARFADQYSTFEELQEGLRKQGLESSNLILGIDFTASNASQGRYTFGGKSLHSVGVDTQNPYQKVITSVAKTLSAFDEDGLIPLYGFGDIRTKDFGVFPMKCDVMQNSLYPSDDMCHGLDEVLSVYNQVAQQVTLSGPTNFAPLIYKAIDICKEDGRANYHILIIICDGQVTNEVETAQAIVAASEWPLSIICIGVGDGPWECMNEFDDGLPARKFDNFQFVDYHKVIREAIQKRKDPDVYFALHALMEIPQQYQAIKKLGLLGKMDTPYSQTPYSH